MRSNKKRLYLVVLLSLFCAAPVWARISEPRGLRLEAGTEINRYLLGQGSGLQHSYPHTGRGYWYLSQGGEWLMYNFSLARKGRYHIWLRVFDDGKHDPQARSVMVEVDGSPFGPVQAHTRQETELWGWTRAATMELEAGCHNLKIIKAQTTPAAALLDAVVISPIENRGTEPAPLPLPLPAEPGQPLVREEIPEQGGQIRIDRPGDPLHGFSIQVPDKSFSGVRNFSVSWTPLPEKLSLPAGIKAVTPMIKVDNGGDYAQEPLTMEIPCRIPDGYFAMPFFYNPDTGALSGMPVVKIGPRSLTAVTKHFSMFFVAMIADADMSGTIETNFRPGKDNWPFKNYGAFTSPGGICAGMAVGAAWYYVNKAGRDANRDLFVAFMDGLDWPHLTPEYPWDDNRAIKFAAMVQEECSYLPAQIQTYYDNFRQSKPGLFDFLTFKSFYLALKLTGQPQTVFVDRLDPATGKWSGHAILATGIDADKGTIKVYDPNYTFWDFRSIGFVDGRFEPYQSAGNAKDLEKGHATSYEVILYAGLDALTNYKKIDSLWQEVESGRIGHGSFPQYGFDVLDRQKQVIGDLKDGFVSGYRKFWFRLNYNAPGELRVTNVVVLDQPGGSADQAGPKPAQKVRALREAVYLHGTKIIQIPLMPGPNRIGIKTKGRAQWITTVNSTEWAGFDWFTVNLTPAEVTCYVHDGATGKPLPGTRISLVSLDAETDSQAQSAGVNGQAEFKDLDAGRYRLTALLAGYQPLKQEIELKPGNNPRLMFRLFSRDAGKEKEQPEPPPKTQKPKPEKKDCEFKELSVFSDQTESATTSAGVKKTPVSKIFDLALPGPGTLRISTRVGGGKHQMSNSYYGANRFVSSVHWSSSEGAVKSGYMKAGDYFYGVRDWGSNSTYVKVDKAGSISLGFKSESCYRAKKDVNGGPACYQCCEDYGVNGIIVLPVKFEIKVEYKPCD